MSTQITRARKAGFAAFVGTTIEWYDFYVYATAAALVFGPLFFPSDDPLAETAAAFATFAVAFLVRWILHVIIDRVVDRIVTGVKRKQDVTDTQALEAFRTLARLEGIIPALESSHAVAWVLQQQGGDELDLICLSGRGDKDLAEALERLGIE